MACALWPLLQENHHPCQLYLELDKENKNVPELLGWDNCMVFPKQGSFSNETWIDALPLFSEMGWAAANFMLVGNVTSVQTFRKVLKKRVQGNIYSQGYWLEGKKGL